MGDNPQASSPSWITVALVLRPHGLKGTMRLKPLTRDAEELIEASVEEFFIRQGRKITGPWRLEEISLHNKVLHARFEGITDRNAAELHTNGELLIREEDLWEQPEDTFYVHELEGMTVVDHATGERLGTVRTAQEGTAQDHLVLLLDGRENRPVLLPFIPQYVPEVDPEARLVRVIIPEGLLDL